MRIQLTGNLHPEEDPEIIIHGKIPRRPEKSCQTCGVISTCLMLQESLKSMQMLAPMPKAQRPLRMKTLSGEIVEDTNPLDIIPLPMPCQGIAWQQRTTGVFESNPLVERLGLSNVKYASESVSTNKESKNGNER